MLTYVLIVLAVLLLPQLIGLIWGLTPATMLTFLTAGMLVLAVLNTLNRSSVEPAGSILPAMLTLGALGLVALLHMFAARRAPSYPVRTSRWLSAALAFAIALSLVASTLIFLLAIWQEDLGRQPITLRLNINVLLLFTAGPCWIALLGIALAHLRRKKPQQA